MKSWKLFIALFIALVSCIRTSAVPPPLTFHSIPPITVSLGKKIPALDLAQYVQGGSAPFAYSVMSQTAPNAIECSLKGNVFASDYAYRAGVNTISVRVTDRYGARAFTTIRVKVAVPSVTYRLYGIDFSMSAQGAGIRIDEITQRMGIIAPYTEWVRSFSSTHGQEHIGAIAHKFGLKACMGAWLTSDRPANAMEMSALIARAQSGEADCAIVGSETLFRDDLGPAELLSYINQFRTAVPNVPVTTADTYYALLNAPQVVADCDFAFVNYYPYWEGQDVSASIADLNAEDALLRHTYPGKEVIVSETGWPSAGNTVGKGIPSRESAASYFVNFESWVQKQQHKAFYFEAFDEDWKATLEAPQEARFGIFDQNGVVKYGADVFAGKTKQDNWTCKEHPSGGTRPRIDLTSVPPVGSENVLQGRVSHATPSNYYVSVYIHDGSKGWWVKPHATSALTLINCDGTWTTNIVTGRNDAFADQIAAFLIPLNYDPPILLGVHSLPPELYSNAVSSVTLKRTVAP